MSDNTEAELAIIGIALIDHAYRAWVSAESESEMMLREWFQAPGVARDAAYRAYRAALEREEAAALDLQRLSQLDVTCTEVLVENLRANIEPGPGDRTDS
jgi:hypothetical protein